MPDLRTLNHPHRFAFRKRCGWCGVQLRRWQRDLCRLCSGPAYGIGSAPCGQGSRWDAAPDTWGGRQSPAEGGAAPCGWSRVQSTLPDGGDTHE